MFAINIAEKTGGSRVMEFDKNEVTIGRIPGNDIVLAKGNISKHHSRIVFKDGKFIIVDLKSTNGTFVNGKKIAAPQVLKSSDKVYIGDYILNVLEAEDGAHDDGGGHDEQHDDGGGYDDGGGHEEQQADDGGHYEEEPPPEEEEPPEETRAPPPPARAPARAPAPATAAAAASAPAAAPVKVFEPPAEEADVADPNLFGNFGGGGGGAVSAAEDEASATRIELAKAYLAIGDLDGARSMLEEVLAEGGAGAKSEAARILKEIG